MFEWLKVMVFVFYGGGDYCGCYFGIIVVFVVVGCGGVDGEVALAVAGHVAAGELDCGDGSGDGSYLGAQSGGVGAAFDDVYVGGGCRGGAGEDDFGGAVAVDVGDGGFRAGHEGG